MDGARCMAPGCSRKERKRGLCDSCYQTFRRMVKAGLTTWEELVEAGYCLDKRAMVPTRANRVLCDLKLRREKAHKKPGRPAHKCRQGSRR
jgi:hypothetical protein